MKKRKKKKKKKRLKIGIPTRGFRKSEAKYREATKRLNELIWK